MKVQIFDDDDRLLTEQELRAISPEPGMVLVLTFPKCTTADELLSYTNGAQEPAAQLQKQVIILFEGQTLEALDDDMMAANGWIRAPQIVNAGGN